MWYDYPTLETENDKTVKEIHAFLASAKCHGLESLELLEC